MTALLQLNQMSLTEALQHCNSGDCTVEQIVDACYDRIEQRESQIQAWQFLISRQDYHKQLSDNKAFYQKSILKGLPVAIKDIIDTADMPTEMGSDIHRGRRPVNDASCVRLLKQAGAIIIGKTVTTEFAYFRPGKTANPCNTQHTPGGSSSGSAAAVSDNMVPVALGSQTAASVIRPAGYCGVLGYVATRGELSLRGVQPLAQSLDSLGIFARCADDIQLLRSILLVHEPIQTQIEKMHIVRVNGDDVGDCASAMHDAMDIATAQLIDKGADVIQGNFRGRLRTLVDIHGKIMAFEVARNIVEEAQCLDALSPQFQKLLEQGQSIKYTDYITAMKQRDEIGAWLSEMYGHADAFLAPSAPDIAPIGLDSTGAPHMSRPWHVLGLPVVSYPIKHTDKGLPLSVQLIGHRHTDDAVLDLCRHITV